MKISEKQFMTEFFKSSKVWGISLMMLGFGLIYTPMFILISRDISLLTHSILTGIILFLVGIYMLYRYEWDIL